MRILLVEDDAVLGEAIRDYVAGLGHAADWLNRLAAAEEACKSGVYDLILLDLGLPDGRGLNFLKARRRAGDATPMIILTAMDQLSMRIEGLNAGADDYLVKPFNLDELGARLHAVARRYLGNPNPLLRIGEVEMDQALRLVFVAGRPVTLSAREWAVLDRLAQRPGVIVSRSQLEDTLFAFGAEVESNAVEVYVSRLRKKLVVPVIQNVRGLGYRLGMN